MAFPGSILLVAVGVSIKRNQDLSHPACAASRMASGGSPSIVAAAPGLPALAD